MSELFCSLLDMRLHSRWNDKNWSVYLMADHVVSKRKIKNLSELNRINRVKIIEAIMGHGPAPDPFAFNILHYWVGLCPPYSFGRLNFIIFLACFFHAFNSSKKPFRHFSPLSREKINWRNAQGFWLSVGTNDCKPWWEWSVSFLFEMHYQPEFCREISSLIFLWQSLTIDQIWSPNSSIHQL